MAPRSSANRAAMFCRGCAHPCARQLQRLNVSYQPDQKWANNRMGSSRSAVLQRTSHSEVLRRLEPDSSEYLRVTAFRLRRYPALGRDFRSGDATANSYDYYSGGV